MKTISPDATQVSRAQPAHCCYKQIMEILIAAGQKNKGCKGNEPKRWLCL